MTSDTQSAWQHYLDTLDPRHRPEVEQWYESRPEEIRDLCRRHPPGTAMTFKGRTVHVVSYIESDAESGPGLMVSHLDPTGDFIRAYETRFFIHLECLQRSC